MIRKLASGLYSWLPMGLRVLRKVEGIVREEMNRAGAQELLMPAVQPAELWQESGRWDQFGPELLRFQDRHQRDFALGPTHEEIITDLVRHELHSYKQLPVTLYQVQTKFRDEVRPRFGVMRSREFIMKDAYSFHLNEESLQQTYQQMHDSYTRIFTRLGLEFRAVIADTGAIGGSGSHEFHVLAESGEDAIAFSTESSYAANIEKAEAIGQNHPRPAANALMTTINTPNAHTIEEVSGYLKTDPSRIIKTLVVWRCDENNEPNGVIALALRGDHDLNEIKATKIPCIYSPLTFASETEVHATVGCHVGSIGPVGLRIPLIADHAATELSDFVCGANIDGKHHTGANWGRDIPSPEGYDIRNVVEGDPSPDGHGTLTIKRGIEVGHIFQLGTKYSEAMGATVLDESGRATAMTMGCYGIGITRIVAAAIEQNHDDKGIIWPNNIAPFQVALLPMNIAKSPMVAEATMQIYQQLLDAGIEVLLDDRNERAGVMFADMELIGIPHRVVVGERGLKNGCVEYKGRRDKDNQEVAMADILTWLQQRLAD